MKSGRFNPGLFREPLYNGIAILTAILLPALLVAQAWNTEIDKAENAARQVFFRRPARWIARNGARITKA